MPDFEINKVMAALKKRGHVFGPSAVSHEGKMLLNMDGRLITFQEAKELLAKESNGK
jgi:hypothetical protein